MHRTRLIDGGHALPYTAIAQAPTVTLPRLKALTTGSNPTFVDALLNLAEETTGSAAFDNVDSWLPQLVVPGGGATAPKKAVFAGDDTWLRLFPKEWFVWHEGVSSFFVSVRRRCPAFAYLSTDDRLNRTRSRSTRT